LYQFEIDTLDKGFIDLSESHFFVPHFGLSALQLKCTKHMDHKAMLFSEEYV